MHSIKDRQSGRESQDIGFIVQLIHHIITEYTDAGLVCTWLSNARKADEERSMLCSDKDDHSALK